MLNSIEVMAKIPANIAMVRRFFWEIQSWQRMGCSMQKVEVLYDDGLFQELSMEVTWRHAKNPIRIIRYLTAKGDIEFCCPIPPESMLSQHGIWKFVSVDQQTRVVAIRNYTTKTLNQTLKNDLKKRLTKLLNTFKQYFEEGNYD